MSIKEFEAKKTGEEYDINLLEQLAKIAEALGCTLYVGKPDELLLDLDSAEQMRQYEIVRGVIGGRFGLTILNSWKSRNGRDHVVLHTDVNPELTVPERIALQAALGSDPKRAALALWEWRESKSDTISLFKPKVAAASTNPVPETSA